MLNSFGVKSKIITLICVPLLFALGLALTFVIHMRVIQDDAVQESRHAMQTGFERTLQYNVEALASQLGTMVEKGDAMGLDIQQVVREGIQGVRYGKDGYYFVFDTEGVYVAHPLRPELAGQNKLGDKDTKGKEFYRELIANAKNGGGITEYWFPKPGQKDASPKMAYSALIPGTNFVLGSGIYVDEIQTESTRIAEHMQGFVDNTINDVSTAGALVLLLVILPLTVLFVRAIVKPLTRAARVADQVAAGNFDHEPLSTGKDEIGRVCAALGAIPKVLGDVSAEFNNLVSAVERGDFGHRVDAETFPGEYGEIMSGGNEMLERFSNFLDQLPTAIAIMDTSLKIRHVNAAVTAAAKVHRADTIMKPCDHILNTDDCKTDKCACARAMQTKTRVDDETVARPGESTMDVAYSGVPLIGRSGEVLGVMEVVQDLTEIKNVQRSIETTAAQATEIANQVASASEELSAQIEQANQGANNQKARVSESATAMEEMNATVLEVAKNASMAAEMGDAARNKAEEGSQVVLKAMERISSIKSMSEQLKADMGELGDQAENIGKVMSVIADIADQTNLLALNAAIEAARAGDAGRGFAVVADEVRKLAEKTMTATHDVAQAIGAIQSSARKSIDGTEQTVQAIDESNDLARTSSEHLQQIVTNIEATAEQIRSIATAAEEQSATSEEITRATEEINQIAVESAEGMEQSSQAVGVLAQMAAQLRSTVDQMKS